MAQRKGRTFEAGYSDDDERWNVSDEALDKILAHIAEIAALNVRGNWGAVVISKNGIIQVHEMHPPKHRAVASRPPRRTH